MQKPLLEDAKSWGAFLELLLSKSLDKKNITDYLWDIRSLTDLSIVINNTCNLNCKHCYLKTDAKDVLTVDEWKKILNNAVNKTDLKMIAIAGKEPFVDNRGITILEHLNNLKKNRDFRYGVVSNGFQALEYIPRLKKLDLSWLDLSVDGTREKHDAIRKKGAFDKAMRVLDSLKDEKKIYVGISSCLSSKNGKDLITLYKDLNEKYNVKNFYMNFFAMNESLKPDLLPQTKTVKQFFEELKNIKTKTPIKYLVEISRNNIQYLPVMKELGLLDWNEAGFDDENTLYVNLDLENVDFYLRINLLPTDFIKGVRITAEGLVIGANSCVHVNEYNKAAAGNIRDYDYDLTKLMGLPIWKEKFEEEVYKFYLQRLPIILQTFE